MKSATALPNGRPFSLSREHRWLTSGALLASLGVLIPLLWPAAIVYAVVWLALLATFRISSVAGMAAALSAPIAAVILHSSLLPMLLGFALLVLWKHRENILRLRRGTEPRIGKSKA